MLENLYTTKMSGNAKTLQKRFSKIRGQRGKFSRAITIAVSAGLIVIFCCATVVMAAFDNDGELENTPAAATGENLFITHSLTWPSESTAESISAEYGTRVNTFTGQKIVHNGIDIAAEKGSDVFAATKGTVSAVDFSAEKGNYIIITDGNGLETLYANLAAVSVGAGDSVYEGQSIGTVGNTGTSTGAHLHFEVKIKGEYYNPMIFWK